MDPKHIQAFLERFRKVFKDKEAEKELLRKTISLIIQEDLPGSAITLKGKTILVKVSPIIRSEMVLKKEDILEKCRTASGLSIDTIFFS